MSDTPLEQISDWSKDYVSKAKESWITTAEQVVALAATAGGVRSLSEQLQISEDKTRELVDSARKALSPAVRAEMEAPVDTRDYGLGVLPPNKDKTNSDR